MKKLYGSRSAAFAAAQEYAREHRCIVADDAFVDGDGGFDFVSIQARSEMKPGMKFPAFRVFGRSPKDEVHYFGYFEKAIERPLTEDEKGSMFLELNGVLVRFWREQGRPDTKVRIALMERMLNWYRNGGTITMDRKEKPESFDLKKK